MARSNYLFTSESVSEGHPDKVCDRISDEVVDLYYRATIEQGLDVWSLRCAAETLATTNRVVIAGEFRGTDKVTKDLIAHHTRMAIRDIGYDQEGFSWQTADIEVLLHGQSEHIAQGVDASGNKEEGAGDQGIMFGYATNETPELMPAPIQYSHRILKLLADARHSGKEMTLAPDAKSQVTVRYDNGKPVEAVSIVLSTQHTDPKQTSEDIRKIVEPYIRQALGETLPIGKNCVWHINPTGKFVIGGPDGDCGLTGRKIIVDSYGGSAHHGGGAFSGKDPSKVDRSAAYALRYVAKNIVAAGLATKCEVQVAYAIGIARPVSLMVDTFGTGKVSDERLADLVTEHFDLRPKGIIQTLNLLRPIYNKTASYGHFGREEPEFTWEVTDKADALRHDAGIKGARPALHAL